MTNSKDVWLVIIACLKKELPRFIKWSELANASGLDRRTVETAVKKMWVNRLLAFWLPNAEDNECPDYCEVCGRNFKTLDELKAHTSGHIEENHIQYMASGKK